MNKELKRVMKATMHNPLRLRNVMIQQGIGEGFHAAIVHMEKSDDLFDFLAHGDHEHRAWLKKAIKAYFLGEPRPEPTGNK